MTALTAAAVVLLLWWGGTAIVVWMDGLPARTFPWSFLAATALLVAGLVGARLLVPELSPAGAFLGFLCGFAAWAWAEVSFYTGIITGPRRRRCPEGCRGWRHLGHALMASLWHELALLAVLGALLWACAAPAVAAAGPDASAVPAGVGNRVALWTYLVLLAGHESARLNVLLGVRNVNAEFLPDHLRYLEGFLRRGRMNALFPVTTLAFLGLTVWLSSRALTSLPGFDAVSAWLLTATAGVAVLEHLMLMVPFPVGRLWSWSLGERQGPPAPARD